MSRQNEDTSLASKDGNTFLAPCMAGCDTEFLKFVFEPDWVKDDDGAYWFLSVQLGTVNGFWSRIKYAWKTFRAGETYSSMILNRDTAVEMRDYIDRKLADVERLKNK